MRRLPVYGDDEEPTPVELEKESHEAASVAYVKQYMKSFCSKCDIRAIVNKWAGWVLVGWGILMASQVFVVIAGRLVIKATVREAVVEVLKESKAIRESLSMEVDR